MISSFDPSASFTSLAAGTSASLATGASAPLATGASAPLATGGSAPLATGGSAPLATGGSAPLATGTSAELAAIFASLVAAFGAAPVDAADGEPPAAEAPAGVPGPPEPGNAREDAGAAGDLQAAAIACAAPPLPWLHVVTSAQPLDVAAAGRMDPEAAAGSPEDAIATGEPSRAAVPGQVPFRTEAAASADRPLDAAAPVDPTPEPADPRSAPTAAGVPDAAATTQREWEAPPADRCPPAARALARALAALERDESGRPAHAAPARAASGSEARQIDARAGRPDVESHAASIPARPPALRDMPAVPRGAAPPALPVSIDAARHDASADATGPAGEGAPAASRAAASSEAAPAAAPVVSRGDVDIPSAAVVPTSPAHHSIAPRAATGPSAPVPVHDAMAGDDHDVPGQILRAIRVQVKDGIGEARIRLRPEFLGDLRIELKVEGDRVAAALHVDRADVRQHIESSGQALRAGLAAQGLELDEFTVREDESSRQEPREREARQQGRRRPPRDDDDAFELPR